MNPVTISQVAWSRPADARLNTLLVVALHGRGADEHSMVAISQLLPAEVTVAAPRAPFGDTGALTWFASSGIGRPIEGSVQPVARAFCDWLDEVSEEHTGVVLLGYSGGATLASGLLLAEPERFSGAVLLSGNLPFEAGFELTAGRLEGMPIFWGNDPADPMIPADLVFRSQRWLREQSGARLEERQYPGMGHGISREEMEQVSAFIEQLAQPRTAVA